jgi:hypothetical protein
MKLTLSVSLLTKQLSSSLKMHKIIVALSIYADLSIIGIVQHDDTPAEQCHHALRYMLCGNAARCNA